MNHKFHIVLPSNSSTKLYPNNKMSSFKVHLTNPLELDPTKWEVALSEIQLVHSWYNIRKGKSSLIKETQGVKSVIDVSEGYYPSIQKLVEEISANDDFLNPIKFEYNTLNQKVKINIPENVKLKLNGSDVARCLGFEGSEILREGTISSTSVSTVNAYRSIYVYTDIIENQYVGDVKVPLLRVIPVTSQHGDNVCVKYDRPYFYNLSRSRIQTIEIDLRDDTGELISFEGGRSIVTLVFRRKAAKFFD